jgi:hypothetical protein
LKIHMRRVSLANHIIRQGEDKANSLLYAIRFAGQGPQRWGFNRISCLRKRFELTPILSKAITLRLSQFGT